MGVIITCMLVRCILFNLLLLMVIFIYNELKQTVLINENAILREDAKVSYLQLLVYV